MKRALSNDPPYILLKSQDLARAATTERISYLLATNADPNYRIDSIQSTLLHTTKSPQLATILIQSKADPNSRNRYNRTPLHECVNEDIATILLDAKADPNATCENNKTTIHYICSNTNSIHNRDKLITLLLQYKANPNIRSTTGRTPLHCPYINKNIIRILVNANADINLVDSYNISPLSFHMRDKDILLSLLHNKADPKSLLSGQTSSPLLYHIKDVATMKSLLVDYNLDSNIYNENRTTPLHIATSYEIVQLLISSQANIDACDHKGNTPLHLTKDVKIASLLISSRANIDKANKHGQTPIAYNTSADIIIKLMDAKADISKPDKSGTTLLNSSRATSVIKLLFNHDKIQQERGISHTKVIYKTFQHDRTLLFGAGYKYLHFLLSRGADSQHYDSYNEHFLHLYIEDTIHTSNQYNYIDLSILFNFLSYINMLYTRISGNEPLSPLSLLSKYLYTQIYIDRLSIYTFIQYGAILLPSYYHNTNNNNNTTNSTTNTNTHTNSTIVNNTGTAYNNSKDNSIHLDPIYRYLSALQKYRKFTDIQQRYQDTLLHDCHGYIPPPITNIHQHVQFTSRNPMFSYFPYPHPTRRTPQDHGF